MDKLKDFVYAARGLRRNPGFALTALVTIALGIGVSTAIFSVVNAVLLRPLPYADAERLVLIWGDMRNRGVTDFPFPPADFQDLREQTTLFDGLAAVVTGRQPISGDDAEPVEIAVGGATPNLFRLLGARIALGRDFEDSDGTPQPQQAGPPGAQPANAQRLLNMAILSHEFWQRRYGGDPGILGRRLDVGGNRAEVVGVLAPGFELLFPPGSNLERVPDVWSAMRIDYAGGSRINVFLRLIARLKPGVTVAQAQAEVDSIAAELRRRFPIKETSGVYFRVEPMHEDLVADVRPAILILMGAVIFVLLIACSNVANLLLVRASLRKREFAVRAAIGGSRWLLIRPMLAESLLLAGFGALMGLGLAHLGIKLLLAIGPEDLPRIESIAIDRIVLAFTALAALASAAVFGVLPALRASRPNVMEVLRGSGRSTELGSGRLLRNGVVMAEVGLSFVLLIGCGLMLRSFLALQRTDPGYDPNGVLTFSVSNSRATGADGRAAFKRQVRELLGGLPGVESVTAATPLPLDGVLSNARWGREEAISDPNSFQQANAHFVLPGYFETLRTPVIEGRGFTEADNRPDARLVVIDRTLAQKAFPNESAVGKRLLARIRTDEPEIFEVIGVVGHQRHTTLAAEGREAMFFTDGLVQHGVAGRWAVRAARDFGALATDIRGELNRLDPILVIAQVQPMEALVDRAMAPTRFALVLTGVFAGIAVLLAAVGLYGVLSTLVRNRTSEIGVRMALGASPTRIFRLVVGQGIRLGAVGIGFGLLAAFGLTRFAATMLVGVQPTDPATFVTIAAFFFLVAVLSCWLPARRAAGLDPTRALREE